MKHKFLFAGLLVVLTVLLGVPFVAGGTDSVAVIVQADSVETAAAIVDAYGGELNEQLAIINSRCPGAATAEGTGMIQNLFRSREAVLLGVLCAMCAVFGATTEYFLNLDALLGYSRYWVAPGLLAIPMTFIIATAGIDLSVGSIVGMCGIILGVLYRDYQWPIAAACAAAVLSGTAAGAFNGGISSTLGIPPLVVTLATMTLFRGIAFGLSQADAISNFPAGFNYLGSGTLFSFWLFGEEAFVPVALVVLLAAMALGVLLLRRTWMGRYTLTIGEKKLTV